MHAPPGINFCHIVLITHVHEEYIATILLQHQYVGTQRRRIRTVFHPMGRVKLRITYVFKMIKIADLDK